MINGIDNAAMAGGSLEYVFRTMQKVENILDKSVSENLTTSIEQKSGVMSRNFASAPKGGNEKNYAKATLAGKQAESVQVNRQNAVLNSAMAQITTSDSYAARVLAGKKAARSMMQEMQRTVQEESGRSLKEVRNAIETTVNETMAQRTTQPDNFDESTAAASAASTVPIPAQEVTATSASAPASAPSSVNLVV